MCAGPDPVARAHRLAQPRVEVLLTAPVLQDPRLVVDAHAAVADLVVGDIEGARQHPGGALHAVAQPHRAQPDGVEVRRGHRHRVGVVDELRVWADLVRIVSDRPVRRHRTEEPEHATGADRVAHGLIDAVAARDLDVVPVGLHAAHLEGDDDDVGVGQRLPAVRRLLHLRAEPVMGDELAGRLGDGVQPGAVDVHQAQMGVLQGGEAEQVPDEAEREHEAPGADDRDLGAICRSGHALQTRREPPGTTFRISGRSSGFLWSTAGLPG